MKRSPIPELLRSWIKLLRWNKPSGRLILLIPAGWALWLIPNPPPENSLIALMILGGISISGAGCIANDLWDRKIDSKIQRTKDRPLAKGEVQVSTAAVLLCTMLLASLLVVASLPSSSRDLCLILAFLALPPILIYPSAKRWFSYPQALLALCWGFAVLIPWAASESNLKGGWPLVLCWMATLCWTFGFDTVYAMADQNDDKKVGLKSSALSLKGKVVQAVSISYALTCLLLASAAFQVKVKFLFWPVWALATFAMQRESRLINSLENSNAIYGKHFQHQVLLGGMLLFGLVLGRMG